MLPAAIAGGAFLFKHRGAVLAPSIALRHPVRSARRAPLTCFVRVVCGAFVISFYASARSLQIDLPVEVIAITSVAANLAAILGGSSSSANRSGLGAVGIIARLPAFCLVIAGAALVPTPLRADSGPA
jgi:hypothetical protein